MYYVVLYRTKLGRGRSVIVQSKGGEAGAREVAVAAYGIDFDDIVSVKEEG